MINLLCILCSLCIQFASAGITPYNMLPNNQSGVGDTQIDIVLDRIRNNYQGYWGNYRWVLNVPRESIVVVKGFTLWGSYNNEYTVLVPKEFNDPNVSSSISCNNYTLDQDNVVNSVTINFNQYIQFFTTMTYINDPYIDGYKTYQFDSANNWELVYCEVPIYCNGDQVIDITDDVTIPEFPSLPGIGSLSPGGHSSGGNPLEALQGFSFTAHSSSYIHSGHNTHVNPTTSTPDFTNATQNLLGQIVDNTNSIIENTNSLGGALETINGNIINGASAIFNAISQFNNNFVSTYVYDQEQVDETLNNSSMLLFAQTSEDLTETIINESQVLLDAVHDMDEKQDLILYLDLTKWKVPVYSSSTGVNTSYVRPYNEVVEIDFTFLKETKSIWQPILLGVLYLALFMSIYFDLPNILRGANA